MKTSVLLVALVACIGMAVVSARMNEVVRMPGHTRLEDVHSPRPHEYMDLSALPTAIDCTSVSGLRIGCLSPQKLRPSCLSCTLYVLLASLPLLGGELTAVRQYELSASSQAAIAVSVKIFCHEFGLMTGIVVSSAL